MKIWLVTDTHWNHKNIVQYQSRPENFNEIIIENWKTKVQPEDQVWHLGDVIIGKQGTLAQIMEQLPGTKILVKGNHDLEKSRWYLSRGFQFVCYGFQYRSIWFTHKPARTLPDGCTINIFGHFHGNDHRMFELHEKEEFGELRDFNKHLHIEDSLSPILLEEFLEKYAVLPHGMLPF